MKISVLLVDDEEMVRESMEAFLNYFAPGRFDISLAENGAEALELIENNNVKFSILITDFNMPKMDGATLIRSVLAQQTKLERIIMLSGKLREDVGINDLLKNNSHIFFLKKPFEPRELLSLVNF